MFYRLKTKLGKLENDFSQLMRANGASVVINKDSESNSILEDENKRLKTKVNKLIDDIKALKEELEKKKREVANLKRISANKKQESQQLANVSGRKRPATPDPNDLFVGQGPTQKSAEFPSNIEVSHISNVQQGDDSASQMALLNSYKTR